jgi:hypothetical protein
VAAAGIGANNIPLELPVLITGGMNETDPTIDKATLFYV